MADRRSVSFGIVASAAAWLPLAGACAGAVAPAKPASAAHTVVIENMQFTPPTLELRRGERVTWVNKDLVPHTVTARDGAFDSHAIAAGASWTFVAARAGTADYACAYHPTMVAHLIVR